LGCKINLFLSHNSLTFN
jgi:cilia- and flagella-associated protein 52